MKQIWLMMLPKTRTSRISSRIVIGMTLIRPLAYSSLPLLAQLMPQSATTFKKRNAPLKRIVQNLSSFVPGSIRSKCQIL